MKIEKNKNKKHLVESDEKHLEKQLRPLFLSLPTTLTLLYVLERQSKLHIFFDAQLAFCL